MQSFHSLVRKESGNLLSCLESAVQSCVQRRAFRIERDGYSQQKRSKSLILMLLLIAGVEPHPGPKVNHHEARKRVCAVCLLKAHKTKSGFRSVNDHQEQMIQEKISRVYDRQNLCLPTGLCNPCRLKIERPYVCKRFPDYSKIFPNGSLKWTRDRESKVESCTCHLCKISSAGMHEFKKMAAKWRGKFYLSYSGSTLIYQIDRLCELVQILL